MLRNDRAASDAAMAALRELAARGDGYHRVPVTDALIAAAVAEQGGLAVLHKDAHFDRLAEVLTFDSVSLQSSNRGDPRRGVMAGSRRMQKRRGAQSRPQSLPDLGASGSRS
jgi:hypothetical protein